MLNRQREASIQVLPDAQDGSGQFWLSNAAYRSSALPPRYTRERERALRALYHHDYNALFTAAVSGIIMRVKSTPWEIKGDDTEAVEQFQAVFRRAHFGKGWDYLLDLVLLDFFRQDGGAYIEVIAPGDPLSYPTGPTVGVAALDSLRCIPTGDPEFPVLYYDRAGKQHLLHASRVIQLVDMPETDDSNPGYGNCALSRSAAIVHRDILMSRYIESSLDDKPAPGIMVASGMDEKSRDRMYTEYATRQSNDARPEWGKQLWAFSLDPSMPVKLESVAFTQPPDKFDYQTYVNIAVSQLALALGVDKQELWELTGGALGSGAQSQILHEKAKGKMIGSLLTKLERAFNDILPVSLEFGFKRKDVQEDVQQAQAAQAYATVVQMLGDRLTTDEARTLLANQVESIHDAITDASGRIRRVNDLDVQPAQVLPSGPAAPVTAEDDTPLEMKALQATRLDFENAFEDALAAARTGGLNKRRFGIVLRALINRYGRAAYRDGMADSGVDPNEMDDNDEREILILIADNSAYVSNFNDTLYGQGISDGAAFYKPAMWYNKSIYPFYTAGQRSARNNSMFEWVLGRTEEHCQDCLRLNGQRHRMKAWVKRGWLPKSDGLSCHGFNCDCKLALTTERARGRF